MTRRFVRFRRTYLLVSIFHFIQANRMPVGQTDGTLWKVPTTSRTSKSTS